MKDTNNKIIVGLLAVIAVCMITIVAILLMNRSNGANNTQVVNEAVNEEYSAEVSAQQENTESQSNISVSATESPYYQYEGELSDTPITPTEIENVEILDHLDDEEAIQMYKDEIMNYVLDYAKDWPVYGNPTIVPGCEPATYEETVIVDIHAADNRLVSFSLETDKSEFVIATIFLQVTATHTPSLNNGLYILNSSNLYDFLTKDVGLDDETAIEEENKILQLIVDEYRSIGISDELMHEIAYIFMDSVYIQIDKNDKVVAYNIDFASTIKSQMARPVVTISKPLEKEEHSVIGSVIYDYSVGTK